MHTHTFTLRSALLLAGVALVLLLASGAWAFAALALVGGAAVVRHLGRLESANAALTNQLATLQEQVRQQDRQVRFGRAVAGIFHDLNHPIQNIGNSTSLLLRDDVDAATRATLGQTLTRELATLRRFMDEVRHVARPQPPDRFPVNVNACVADAIDAVREEAGRSLVALTGRFAPHLPMIDADRFALDRVYRNLLVNAVQATPPGGSVTVGTRLVDNLVEVDVSDTGVGIPPDRLPSIFDDFATTKPRGLGLGLATSRRTVELLGGSIEVTSQQGRGSTFAVRFPARISGEAEAAS